jgi:hypothetical protein
MFWLFNQIAAIGLPGMLWYGAFLFASVFSYTTLMDKSRWSVPVEVLRTAFGLGLLWWHGGDWFGMGPVASYAVAGFLVASVAVALVFTRTEVGVEPVRLG